MEVCEKDPLKAYELNSPASRNLAHVARQIGAVIVHVSMGSVFDGSKKVQNVEADPALPLNLYGDTKLAGESVIRTTADKYFILRTSGVVRNMPMSFHRWEKLC